MVTVAQLLATDQERRHDGVVELIGTTDTMRSRKGQDQRER